MSLLPIKCESDPTGSKLSGFSGVLPYVDLLDLLKIPQAADAFLGTGGEQGWMDRHHVITAILLNIVGGDCVDDISILEDDDGLRAIMHKIEVVGLSRIDRRLLDKRFRKGRSRTFSSPTSMRNWLECFHNPSEEAKRQKGVAFIPESNSKLLGLLQINDVLIQNTILLQKKTTQPPITRGTVNLDATFTETQKHNSFYCYKKFQAYQGLTAHWEETGQVLISEFRDGNVPPSYNNIDVTRQSFNKLTELGLKDLWFRSDSAAYQHELTKMLDSGDEGRWSKVHFAIPCDMVKEFRVVAEQVEESDWVPVYNKYGDLIQEWSEVPYCPSATATSKVDFQYIAVRTPMKQGVLPGMDTTETTTPNSTLIKGNRAYRLTGLVTNIKDWDGARIIKWCYERCGKGEEIHSVMTILLVVNCRLICLDQMLLGGL